MSSSGIIYSLYKVITNNQIGETIIEYGEITKYILIEFYHIIGT
jgi:hypothetical protein